VSDALKDMEQSSKVRGCWRCNEPLREDGCWNANCCTKQIGFVVGDFVYIDGFSVRMVVSGFVRSPENDLKCHAVITMWYSEGAKLESAWIEPALLVRTDKYLLRGARSSA